MSETIKIWAKELWDDTDFILIDFLNIEFLEAEERGLGRGSVKVLLSRYNEDLRDNWENSGADVSLTNYWIFVQNCNAVKPTQDENGEDVVVDTNADGYQPTGNGDPSFMWTGYCGEFTREIQLTTGDSVGNMNLYEIGHYVNKHLIEYIWQNENGFNPIVNGKLVGNKDTAYYATDWDTYYLKSYGNKTSVDPDEVDSFFTVKEAVNNIIMNSMGIHAVNKQFDIYPDWSWVDMDKNKWLDEFESIDSFVGQNLTDALQSIFDYISWTYLVGEDGKVYITFFDRNGSSSTSIDWNLDESCASYMIMSEQQSYDSIELVGDRILFYGSASTYTPFGAEQSVGVFPKWTTQELSNYVSPRVPVASNENYTKLMEKTYSVDAVNMPKDETDVTKTFDEQWYRDSEFAEYKMARQSNKKPYQDFYFGYVDPVYPAGFAGTEADCFAVNKTPGAYVDDSKETYINDCVPLFPNVVMQYPMSEMITTEDGVEHVPTDSLYTNVMILDGINTIDKKEIGERFKDHWTPPATEMKYSETTINPDETNGTQQQDVDYKNTFYIRSYSFVQNYTNGAYFQPIWLDGTYDGLGFMASKMTLDYDGVTLESPEPEVLACPDDVIYQSVNKDGSYATTVIDFGVKRDEWKSDLAGASKFDYYRTDQNWRTRGHWGRMVFSFGAYSAQRIRFIWGFPDGFCKNVLVINDPSYKMAIARKGYVQGITYNDAVPPNPGVLKYTENDIMVRNDLPKMANRMEELWNYYSRERKAVKTTHAMFDVNGNINQPLGAGSMAYVIGTYITKSIFRDAHTYDTNSYVSSVEMDFSSDSPRMIIQTEYPDSPKRTREKKLPSIYKEQKYKWKEVI